MAKKVTYLFGAGASANSIPVVNSLTERFKIFCDHLNSNFKDDEQIKSALEKQQKALIRAIESHYTFDTYAKKLFLQNRNLNTNVEYCLLTKYLSVYFLYEQLKFKKNASCNQFIDQIIHSPVENAGPYLENVKKILIDLDYRYDSFFASVLIRNEENKIVLPENINLISWNYDFQIEKAYMNFSTGTLGDAIDNLNQTGTAQVTLDKQNVNSHLVKLNGTAGFLKDKNFGELFDFSDHFLDNNAFDIFKEILSSPRNNYENAIRFSWENDPLAKKAIDLAQLKIKESDIIVVIGYSFPYFNRETDRVIFAKALEKPDTKIYIQAPEKDINSIIKRFEGVLPGAKPDAFTEIDQFLIPNEM